MNKIKKLFSSMIDSVKKSLNTFPITTIIIFCITFIITFFVIGVDLSSEDEEIISHILILGGISAIGTWFVESLFDDKKKIKTVIFYIISFVIAIIFDRLIYNIDSNYDGKVEEYATVIRWLMEYIIICFLGTIYTLSKKSKMNFEKYILNLFLKLNQLTITFFIVTLGFLFLYFIFIMLILNSLSYEVFLKLLCLFTGFYYMPVMLKAFEGSEEEDTKFNKFVFLKILLPLLIVAMLIIYMYIVKLFILSALPNKHIFMILSVIFVFAFPIYFINKNYVEDGLNYKINKAIPYLYIPFIFLQIYAIWLRVREYGITVSRYMAIVLIIFEIISIFLSIYKKSKYLNESILAVIIISVVVMITPLNFERVPMLSQKAVVDKFVESDVRFEELSDSDKKRVAGAYQYIQYDEKYINPNLTDVEKKILASYNTYRSYNSDYDYNYDRNYNHKKYYNFYKELNELNIDRYEKMYILPYTYCSDDATIEYRSNKINIKVNIRDYIDKLIDADKTNYSKKLFEQDRIIKIDDNLDLYLNGISFDYDRDTKELQNVNVEGFIFKK